MDELLIAFGGEVKQLGDGRVGGYLVRFSGPKDTDLTGDFFSKDTDFGIHTRLPVYYQHGYDSALKTRRIGVGELKLEDAGLWLEAQLELRDDYERMIADMAGKSKLGLSSGAVGHLVERERVGKANHIKTWVIGEASLTPTPAEPRNNVLPLKSYFDGLRSADLESVKTIRELEDYLRDAGVSRSQATAIVAKAKTLLQRDSDEERDSARSDSRIAYARRLETYLLTGVQ
jgi:hypothetical protein